MCCDGPAIFDAHVCTARKRHCCCECLVDIRKGEKYMSIRGLWEGRWEKFSMCLNCESLFNRVQAELREMKYCDCICYTELMDSLDRGNREHKAWLDARDQRYWQHRAEREQRELCLRW